jgi:hypothetical protein
MYAHAAAPPAPPFNTHSACLGPEQLLLYKQATVLEVLGITAHAALDKQFKGKWHPLSLGS